MALVQTGSNILLMQPGNSYQDQGHKKLIPGRK